jgi:hypothetical protein
MKENLKKISPKGSVYRIAEASWEIEQRQWHQEESYLQ